MAESGQQPTVDATLVNDIFEMLMEMDIRKIDIRLQRQYFDRLLHDLRNQPPEVSVVRLRKFMATPPGGALGQGGVRACHADGPGQRPPRPGAH